MKSLEDLYEEVLSKRTDDPNASNTAKLIASGVHSIGKKIVEEAAEVWMAAEYQSDEALALEISQLLYHLTVLAAVRDISLTDIYQKL
jgi:phosphoribosyl-ATP pyrophosphohydrolase